MIHLLYNIKIYFFTFSSLKSGLFEKVLLFNFFKTSKAAFESTFL